MPRAPPSDFGGLGQANRNVALVGAAHHRQHDLVAGQQRLELVDAGDGRAAPRATTPAPPVRSGSGWGGRGGAPPPAATTRSPFSIPARSAGEPSSTQRT